MNHIIRKLLTSGATVAVLTIVMSGASIAHASVVTGTLTGGASSGSTVTGTLTGGTTGAGTGGSLSGTVTGGTSGGGGGNTVFSGGGGGVSGSGGGTSGSGSPQGEVLGASTGPVAVGTTSFDPGAPNTGMGGNAPMNYLLLTLSGLVAAAGTVVLLRRKAA